MGTEIKGTQMTTVPASVVEAACRAWWSVMVIQTNMKPIPFERMDESCQHAHLERQRAALEAAAPLMAAQWIACSERMPEDNKEVLVHCSFADEYGSWTGAGFHVPAGWKSQDSMIMDDIPIAFPVTHWQPFPQPPKETI